MSQLVWVTNGSNRKEDIKPWMHDLIIGDPQPTPHYDDTTLKSRGIVGFYKQVVRGREREDESQGDQTNPGT